MVRSQAYFGGRIVAELGPHQAYWELFCGSMAVLLAKEPCTTETVNDLHGDLVNLGRVVAHDDLHRVLHRKLIRTLASKVLMDEAAARYRLRRNTPAGIVPDLDRAYDYFLSTWLGRNGVAGTQSYNQGYSRRFTKSGGNAARRWCSAVDSVPAWWGRLRGVSIESEDAFGLLEKIEDAFGVVIYLDPPYFDKGAKWLCLTGRKTAFPLGRYPKTGEKVPGTIPSGKLHFLKKHRAFLRVVSGVSKMVFFRPVGQTVPIGQSRAKYIHDADDSLPAVARILGITDPTKLPPYAWHHALAKLVSRFKKTRVVISYYEHPELDGLYQGWTKIRLKATKALVNQGMRDATGTVDAPEVLLINGPSLAVKAQGGLFE